jgi:hypothetical protein
MPLLPGNRIEDSMPRVPDGDAAMDRFSGVVTDDELLQVCRSTLSACPEFRGAGEISAEFYPYIGLTHILRRLPSGWSVRISDHCRGASVEVLQAVVMLLAAKITRRKLPAGVLAVYETFRKDPEVAARVQDRRRRRGRKRIDPAPGRHHSLREVYRELNERYFNGQVEICLLGWGARRSWRRLGHYDPIHHTITISPVLDSPKVPGTVIAYLVYHEMLHAVFSDAGSGGSRRYHTREFYSAERAFPHHDSSRRFLERFCRARGR